MSFSMRMRAMLAFALTAAAVALHAQQTPRCASEMDEADWQDHREAVVEIRKTGVRERSGNHVLLVPVQMHIVRRSNGTGGLTAETTETALDRANLKYASAGIRFFECETPHFIDSDYWYNTALLYESERSCGANTPEYQLTEANNVPDVVNIYWLDTDGWSWAPGPSSKQNKCWDWIIMNRGHADSYATLAHELGHYFGLPHTFNGLDENVTRNPANACFNADTHGDLFTDTPADRHDNDPDDDWSDCAPVDKYDGCGQLLVPDPLNIMSYSHCDGENQYFSAQQRAKLLYTLTRRRAYLSCVLDCVEDRDISFAVTHAVFQTYPAQHAITSRATLHEAGVAVRYIAGDIIQLKPGFSAPTGVTFSARIGPCPAPVSFAEAPPGILAANRHTSGYKWSAYITPSATTDAARLMLTLPEATRVSVWLIGADGRIARSILADTDLPAGEHQIAVEGAQLPAGIYKVLIRSENGVEALSFVKM